MYDDTVVRSLVGVELNANAFTEACKINCKEKLAKMTYVQVTLLKVCFAHLVQQDTESACTMINIYTLA